MRTARSASRTWSAFSSAVEYTATASTPSSCSARMTRTAISPRLATRTRVNTRRVYGRRRLEPFPAITHEGRNEREAFEPAGPACGDGEATTARAEHSSAESAQHFQPALDGIEGAAG